MIKNESIRWCLLAALILALILVPFALFGERLELWTAAFLDSAREHRTTVALVLGGLLAADFILPTPSSLVSTACGLLLGFIPGTLVSLTGMTVSCALGYALGRFGRTAVRRRLLSEHDLDRLDRLYRRTGDWLIVVTRAVPVLAEAAVLFAGMGRMPLKRFFILSILSNTGISLVYSLTGSLTSGAVSFFASFAGAILLPLAAMLIMRRKESA